MISSSDGLAIRSNQYVEIANNGTISGDIDVTAERDVLVPVPFHTHVVRVSETTAVATY